MESSKSGRSLSSSKGSSADPPEEKSAAAATRKRTSTANRSAFPPRTSVKASGVADGSPLRHDDPFSSNLMVRARSTSVRTSAQGPGSAADTMIGKNRFLSAREFTELVEELASRVRRVHAMLAASMAAKEIADQVKSAEEKEKVDRRIHLVEVAIFQLREMCLDGVPLEEEIPTIVNCVEQSNLLQLLIQSLTVVRMDSRVALMDVLCMLLNLRVGDTFPMVDFVVRRPEILNAVFAGSGDPDVALILGTILRLCLRHKSVVRLLLVDPVVRQMFLFVRTQEFSVQSDQWATFETLLLSQPRLTRRFLRASHTFFFEEFRTLVADEENYAVRRNALHLLRKLLDACDDVVQYYVSDDANLKLVMITMRDTSSVIRVLAMKLFVYFLRRIDATGPTVEAILTRNSAKLFDLFSSLEVPDADASVRDEILSLLSVRQSPPMEEDEDDGDRPEQQHHRPAGAPATASELSATRPSSDLRLRMMRSRSAFKLSQAPYEHGDDDDDDDD